MSKFPSSTHTGRAAASGGNRTFWRKRGARCRREEITRTRSAYVSLPVGAVDGSRMATPPTCWWTEGVSRYRNEASCGPSRSIGYPRWRNSSPRLHRYGAGWCLVSGSRGETTSVVVLAVHALVPVALGVQAEHRPHPARVAPSDHVAG